MALIKELIKQKKISQDQAKAIYLEEKEAGRTPEEVILERHLLPEKELFQIKADLLDIPLKQNLDTKPSPALLRIIPQESMEYYKMIPLGLDRKNNVLEVGMVYPDNSQAREALNFLVRQQKLSAKIFLISLSGFSKLLQNYGGSTEEEVEKALQAFKKKTEGKEGEAGEAKRMERLVEEAPVVKMVGVILRHAVEGRASDIHIEPTKDNLRVRYRFDGVLHSSLTLPLKIHPAIVARIKILAGLKIDETRKPQDGRLSSKISNRNIDFRVASLPTTLGEKIAIRVLDPEHGLYPLEDLGLSSRDYKLVKETAANPYGMILATGPTGSGKTTTLYSLIKILNKEGVNIITLEDPVEYFMGGVNQSQVQPEIGYTFASGLRQILRQDPDIIMVGEIRDQETASLAIHAALTGHLVLSTLHTTTAAGVMPRLIDMGVENFLLSSTLSLAMAQRLARGLCDNCKKKVKAKGGVKEYILKNLSKAKQTKNLLKEPIYIYEPVGCEKCDGNGYKGRLGVFEILAMTDELAEVIIENPSPTKIMEAARAQGMTTMEEDGIKKALQGKTSIEEVMRVAKE